jgi:hypothetical protein
MSKFAKVENGVVTNVLVIEQDQVNTGNWGDPSLWIETCSDTKFGVHYGPDGQPDGGVALRGNFAGLGQTYDYVNDVFYQTQPYPSWIISAPTWVWQPPIAYPTDGKSYLWDEATQTWVYIEI